jgi:hypothetical protein
MRFKSDIRKMRNNPTYGSLGTDGPMEVVIFYQDSESRGEDWKYFETAAENVTYDEGLEIERNRLDELEKQFKDRVEE